MDPKLLELVQELNDAEMDHFDNEGPLRTCLHEAIVALCEYAGVEDTWRHGAG